MSKKIQVDKKTYKILETQAEKDGLTIPQEIELAMLYGLRNDSGLFRGSKTKS